MPVVDGRYSVYNEGCGQTGIPETFTLSIGARFLDPKLEIREYHGEVLSTYGCTLARVVEIPRRRSQYYSYTRGRDNCRHVEMPVIPLDCRFIQFIY